MRARAAVLTATVALWKFVGIKQVAFMPLFSLVIGIWTFMNIKRQYRRFLEVTSWINQIEKYLGLHIIIEEESKRFFKDDTQVIPQRWYESSEEFKTGKEFVDNKAGFWRHSAYSYFGILFLAFSLFSALLVFLIWNTPVLTE